jgi:predicted nucleotidyltransferase
VTTPAWLEARTILLVRTGSRAYGTSLPSSDEDRKGVCVPPPSILFSFAHEFEQSETHAPDVVIYELRKFMSLAAECNPSLIEVLWTDDPIVVTPAGSRLVASRAAFLSRKARHTFAGYALSQLRRIQTHHRWLASPPSSPPARADFDLPETSPLPREQLLAAEAAIMKQMDLWDVDLETLDEATKIALKNRIASMFASLSLGADAAFAAAGRAIGYDENFLALLDRERRYRARQREWEQFQMWKRERNPVRAELEARFGYDTKHALHLVRLLRMCREILESGKVIVRRPDADELLAIRAGAWSYERLVAYAEDEDRALDALARTSPLPAAPDRAALDRLCVEITSSMI